MLSNKFKGALRDYQSQELSLNYAKTILLLELTPKNIDVAMPHILPTEVGNRFLCWGAQFALIDNRYRHKKFDECEDQDIRRGVELLSEWLLRNPDYHERARDLAATNYAEWKRTDEAERRAEKKQGTWHRVETKPLDAPLDLSD